jgi:hypothetical protein
VQEWQIWAAVEQIQERWRASTFRDRRAQVAELNRWEVDVAQEVDPAAQDVDLDVWDLIEQIRSLRHAIRTSLHP